MRVRPPRFPRRQATSPCSTRPRAAIASAIDVVATITNLRGSCVASGARLVTSAASTCSRCAATIAGRATWCSLFRDGGAVGHQRRLQAQGPGRGAVRRRLLPRARRRARRLSSVAASAATLPQNIRRLITAERRAGDPNAALDPLSDPAVRQAVEQARFELLVGFELTADQLRYNATR
jgi:hypothetical protein